MDFGIALAIAGAAVAVALSGIGSSIGVGYAGRASGGVLAEEPEKFGNLLILTALPGTQGIYGFVAAFFVMIKTDLLGEAAITVTTPQGLAIFFACLPMALAGLFSGIHQGKVSAAGVGVVVKQPADSMKAVIMSVLVETYAVLGLLITIMLIIGIKVG
jgi:V/A-type H+-transporting ATPase subunit K